jgi:hypothetical protein
MKTLIASSLTLLMSLSAQAQFTSFNLQNVVLADHLSADADEGQTEWEFPCTGTDGNYDCGNSVQFEDELCAASLDWKVRKGLLVCELSSGEVVTIAKVPSVMEYSGTGPTAHYNLQYSSRVSLTQKNGQALLRIQ